MYSQELTGNRMDGKYNFDAFSGREKKKTVFTFFDKNDLRFFIKIYTFGLNLINLNCPSSVQIGINDLNPSLIFNLETVVQI